MRANVRVAAKGRIGRILEGWSANFVQTALGIIQQVALVPIFLHFWTNDVLAAWLTLYSVGYLVLIADAGLQMRAINRFLRFRASADPDGRTARFFSDMLKLYVGWSVVIVVIVLISAHFFRPSVVLGFTTDHFDLAFVSLTMGMIVTLPTNLASALYRARGFYGRIVKIQCWSMVIAQLGQLIALICTQSLLVVTLAYATAQIFLIIFVFFYDVPRLFPFLRTRSGLPSWRWVTEQFRCAFPFAIVMAAEGALVYAPVLFVSVFVSDRVAVVQWGLTRVIAGLVRGLSAQATLPLAAELGHDHAVGKVEQLQSLYARGSVLVTLMAAVVISGLIAFWPDFFVLWTRGSIPYDRALTLTLLIGTSAVAPSILALSFANYTDRGRLLAWTKGLQLTIFLALCTLLIPRFGALGAAVAIVASDLLIQFGVLTTIVLRQTLQHPVRHVMFLIFVMITVIGFGWAMGLLISSSIGKGGLVQFILECTIWLILVSGLASPLANAKVRAYLDAAIPR